MKLKIFFIFAFSFSTFCYSQELVIESFYEIIPSKVVKLDLNGDECATLNIISELNNLEFSGNIVEKTYENNNYRLFIVDKTKKITIYSSGSIPYELDFTLFPFADMGLKGGKNYELKINKELPLDQKLTQADPIGGSFLVFTSDIPIKQLRINGVDWEADTKSVKKMLPYGRYHYECVLSNDKFISGEVDVKKTFGDQTVRLNSE